MSKDGFAPLSLFKIDRIPSFDIRHSVFDIRYSLFKVSQFDPTGRPGANGWPETRNLKPET
jgi:hypothetical protein